MVCYVCKRDRDREKFDGRQCTDKTGCYLTLARTMFSGGVVGVYKRGPFKGQARMKR